MPAAASATSTAARGSASAVLSRSGAHRRGFNPIFYPDLELDYQVSVTALDGDSFRISVDLDRPLPREWVGRVGFNFELFPAICLARPF